MKTTLLYDHFIVIIALFENLQFWCSRTIRTWLFVSIALTAPRRERLSVAAGQQVTGVLAVLPPFHPQFSFDTAVARVTMRL